jgi:aspartokinase-like uncharacterized kinase
MPTVVFKLGGSLLDQPGLPRVVRSLTEQRLGWGVLWIVGGGTTADIVRNWDAVHQLGDDTAHWLALEAMSLNESLVHRLCPELRLVRSGPQFEKAVTDGVPALCCAACFVRWGEAVGVPLPHSWDVTSDSIAAWAARVLSADELVLVKSVPAPRGRSFSTAAAERLVDPCFPALAESLPAVAWANGRANSPEIVAWGNGSARE